MNKSSTFLEKNEDSAISNQGKKVRDKLLLHVCCAPCASYVIKLLQADYDVTANFFNPNIYPEEEFKRRLNEVKKYLEKIKMVLEVGEFNQEYWFELVKGLENEPERGARCTICYKMRMEEIARQAKENNFDYFTTDLSISPHKDAIRINKIGNELAEKYGVKFLEADFKKKDGFKKSLEISRDEGFYRQDYCGCVYSWRQKQSKNNQETRYKQYSITSHQIPNKTSKKQGLNISY